MIGAYKNSTSKQTLLKTTGNVIDDLIKCWVPSAVLIIAFVALIL